MSFDLFGKRQMKPEISTQLIFGTALEFINLHCFDSKILQDFPNNKNKTENVKYFWQNKKN